MVLPSRRDSGGPGVETHGRRYGKFKGKKRYSSRGSARNICTNFRSTTRKTGTYERVFFLSNIPPRGNFNTKPTSQGGASGTVRLSALVREPHAGILRDIDESLRAYLLLQYVTAIFFEGVF